jgi:hypothetical protein
VSLWPTFPSARKSATALPDSLLKISYLHSVWLLTDVLKVNALLKFLPPPGGKFKVERERWKKELHVNPQALGWVLQHMMWLEEEHIHRFDSMPYAVATSILVSTGHSKLGTDLPSSWLSVYVGPEDYDYDEAHIAYRRWLVNDFNGLAWTNRLPPVWWINALKKKSCNQLQ